MNVFPEKMPESAAELKDLLVSLTAEYQARIQEQERELKEKTLVINEQNNQIILLTEQLKIFRQRLFGRSSEKLSAWEQLQGRLFDEAEATAAALEQEQKDESIIVSGHRRKKGGRKPLPESIIRIDKVHDISEEEKLCPCGNHRVVIGEETSEELEFIPAQLRVLHHRRLKYACPDCEGSEAEGEPAVLIAPPPVKLIKRSISTPSLLAAVMTGKFCDHLPFARQEKQFARIGVEISRQDMSNWTLAVGRSCEPLVKLLNEELLLGETAGADETRVQVHREDGKKNTAESTMWVFHGGPPGKKAVLYHYGRTGEAKVALLILKGFTGYLQTDGSDKYTEIEKEPGVIHVGCMAHARRRFMDAKKIATGKSSADDALDLIKDIYRIERDLRSENLSPDAFLTERRRQVQPVLDKFFFWLEKKRDEVPPKTLIGIAVSYTFSQWPKLIRYLDHGDLTPDNNLTERIVRPFVW
jgi:transposase